MMRKLVLSFLTVCLMPTLAYAREKKNADELISELKYAGNKAVHLVQSIKASGPNEGDLLTLRDKYNGAKDAYSHWADEAADAITEKKPIDIHSKLAREADQALGKLSAFGKGTQSVGWT